MLLSFTIAKPGLSRLLSGEGLALLINLGPITGQASLCDVADDVISGVP